MSENSEESKNTQLVNIITPLYLRRLKSDLKEYFPIQTELILLTPLSSTQRQYYRWILTKNFSEFNKPRGKRE
jgi:chromodomain-helicase-DNA-binding protein 1